MLAIGERLGMKSFIQVLSGRCWMLLFVVALLGDSCFRLTGEDLPWEDESARALDAMLVLLDVSVPERFCSLEL